VRGEYSLEEQQEYYKENPEIFGDIVECYEKFCWYPRCNIIGKEKEFSMLKNIIFAPDLLTSQTVVDKYNEWSQTLLGRDIACHIDANTPDEIRVENLRRFALPSEHPDSLIVISNFSLFLEGYNLPSLSVTQWLRKSASVIVVCQGNGRSCRYEHGKLQWVLDHVGNTLEHGNPDEDREFSLSGKKKKPKDYSIKCPSCGEIITDNYVKYRLDCERLSKLKRVKVPTNIICECGCEVFLPQPTKRERKEREELELLSGVEWEVGTNDEVLLYQKFKKYQSLPSKTFLQRLVKEGMTLEHLIQACQFRCISNEYASNVWMEHMNKSVKSNFNQKIRKELFG
jgi:superfamily II DNA or RNA helicase